MESSSPIWRLLTTMLGFTSLVPDFPSIGHGARYQIHIVYNIFTIKPGFHIIAPVATVVAIVEKRVLTQKYFLSDASDTVFPYDRRCRSITLKLGRGDLGSITNF